MMQSMLAPATGRLLLSSTEMGKAVGGEGWGRDISSVLDELSHWHSCGI